MKQNETGIPVAEFCREHGMSSMDFMSDALADGRTLRTFNVLDDYSSPASRLKMPTLNA